MAEKKKKKLEAMLEDFQKLGGDIRSVQRKFQDPDTYKANLSKAREWASPGVKRLMTLERRKLREGFKGAVKSYLEGSYKKSLTDRLGEGEELPEGHEYSFSHLGNKAPEKARDLLDEVIFHGMERAWGQSAKDLRKKYEQGDVAVRDQVQAFVDRYVRPTPHPEGREEDAHQYLDRLAQALAQEDDVLEALDSPNGEFNMFLHNYSAALDRFALAQAAYINGARAHARAHKKHVQSAANKVAGQYGHELKEDAEANEMIGLYLGAHGKNYNIKRHESIVRPLPQDD